MIRHLWVLPCYARGGTMRSQRRAVKREAVKQTPRERLISGNKRVVHPETGRTTWFIKAVQQ